MPTALKLPLRRACYGTIGFEVVFTVVCVIVMVTQCIPLSKLWDLTGATAGTCIDHTALFYSMFGSSKSSTIVRVYKCSRS